MLEVIASKYWYINEFGQLEVISVSGRPKQLPDDGLLGVVLFFNDDTRRLMNGHDYYFIADSRDGVIYGQDVEVRERNVQKEIVDRYGPDTIVIRGVWTDDNTMKIVDKEMLVSKCH